MNEERLDGQTEHKENVPVKHQQKKEQHGQFKRKHRSKLWVIIAASAVVIALVISAFLFPDIYSSRKAAVSADSLKIATYASLVDLGKVNPNGQQILGITEYNGTIYLNIADHGIFSYNSSGLQPVYDKETSWVKISPNGKMLVLADNNGLLTYDLQTKESRILVGNDNIYTYYEQPSWSPDGNSVLCIRKVFAQDESQRLILQESSICLVDRATSAVSVVASGSNASFAGNDHTLVYERENQIYLLDIESMEEKLLGEGRSPSVSPDGNLIVYNKGFMEKRDHGTNIWVEETIDDLWIADLANFTASRKLTDNLPYHFIDENEWAKGLEPTDYPQVLFFLGQYNYFNPSWSSDSQNLYAVKISNADGEMRLMKVCFSEKALTNEDTVRNYLQALVLRDDDYARSLLSKKPEKPLTLSNPHPVGYRIIGSGTEEGKPYVDAELYLEYSGSAYFQQVTSRYLTGTLNDSPIIEQIRTIGMMELFEKDGIVQLTRAKDSGETEKLFSLNDIPTDFGIGAESRINSIAYNQARNSIVMAVSTGGNEAETVTFKIIQYDISGKQFTLIDTLSGFAAVGDTLLSADGKYLAFNASSGSEENNETQAFIYDLESHAKQNISSLSGLTFEGSTSVNYWDENLLIFSLHTPKETVKLAYAPDKKKVQTLE